MHRHERAILEILKKEKKLDFETLMKETGLGKDAAMWAVSNLFSRGSVEAIIEGKEIVALTEEGKKYAANELPEQKLIRKLAAGEVVLDELKGNEDQIALIWAKKKGLVEIGKKGISLTEKGSKAAKEGLPEDKALKEINAGGLDAYAKYKNNEIFKELEKRKLVTREGKGELKEVMITQHGVLELASDMQSGGEEIEALDRSMLSSRVWAGKKFKAYNVEAPVEAKEAAVRHPLRNLINEIRQAYLSLGFTEVTGPVIDSSFWVFDYLFMPQHHPARGMQDTFFLSRPRELEIKDRELVKRIKEEHEKAWHSEWSEATARLAVPRTHMTSVTGRYMHEIIETIQKEPDKYELPVKIFSVGRVFRNENIDFKHLADFYQMDGMMIGKQLTLANLFDVLLKLYSRLGIRISFKPSFFPYVEPGVEAYTKFGDSELELFGAGMIRNEITGVKRNSLSVLAWGPGVERVMLLRNEKIGSIASMYNTNIGWLRSMSMK